MTQDRLKQAGDIARGFGVDGILVTNGTNRRYLTGFTGEDHAVDELSGVALTGSSSTTLFAPATNLPWAQSEAAEGVDVLPMERRWTDSIATFAKDAGWKRLGFEDATTSYAAWSDLRKALGDEIELVPVGNALDTLRAVKDADEIELLRTALRMTDEAFVAASKRIVAGMTEAEAAAIVVEELRNVGSEGESFPTIVASGPNAAKPHHAPGDRVIEDGEPVIIDMGALHKGYAGDLTRTIWFGQPSEQLVTIYSVVQAAQEAAIAAARPGITGVDFDAAARDVFAEHQLDHYFVHSLGHGLGLRVHEAPSASMRSEDTLAPGNVVTVEPGLYIPDWGGVRIEDVLLIDDESAENLTTAPKRSVHATIHGE
ncbi:MAG TPA: Xaa-Pro peptidase family protein [Thermomicrobiales bacterium]|nr:Xaa-Pro peptidase family protein [Thermomicrobiales bacterium]